VSKVAKRERASGQPHAGTHFEAYSSDGQPRDDSATRTASRLRGRPRDRARRSRHTHRMGNYAVTTSHRNPLATQVTVWRGNASRRKLREASASSMGIRAVRSRSSCGQPYEGIGFTPGSAQWGRGRRSGNRAANEGSTARATCVMGRASMFRATGASMLASEHRRPVQLGLLHRSGNRVARWLCCSGAPYGWAASTSGKPDEEAAR
jgi:hypothetical protein